MRRAICLAMLASCLAAARGAAVEPPTGDWLFEALLDGRPIGQHRITVSGEGAERSVSSEADFVVKILGFTAYRYHHQATEQWRAGCLVGLQAKTNDDGKSVQVRESPGEGKDCVMSFAYWNPAIRTQTQLLNAQTGKLESVQVKKLEEGTVVVRGKPVEATAFRITGPEHPIVVWYAADGRWVGLDSTVAGGRKLSYRIQ